MNSDVSPQAVSSRRRLKAALGSAAGLLLLVSLALPYWQARLFAPQYRDGLRATMYAFKVGGDVKEIDGLNHYVGVSKLGDLAKIERVLAIPAVLTLAVFCFMIPRVKSRAVQWLFGAGVLSFPVVFVVNLKFWLHYASTHLDPTAPLKLKPFSIPIYGIGKVGQFRSEVGPMFGYWLALLAAALVLAVLLLPDAPKDAGPSRPGDSTGKRAGPIYGWMLLSLLAPSILGAATLQERIDSAEPGTVLEITGRHSGPITISKTLCLKGAGEAVIDGENSGTVVTVRAPGVTLENLTVRNSGESFLMEDSGVRVEAASAVIRGCVVENVLFGIFVAQGPAATIVDNRLHGKNLDLSKRGDLIRLWYSDRAVVRGNQLNGGRDAVLWFSTGSVVEDNTFSGGRYGLHFMYTNSARVAGNILSDNSVGAYIMYSQDVAVEKNRFERNRGPSGIGLGLKESDRIQVSQNVFKDNRQGLFVDQSPIIAENVNRFSRNLFANNDVGIAILPGAKGDVFSANSFQDNQQQVSVRGGGELTGTLWQQGGFGNFWSDYAGYGAAKSLVGRIPYRVESAFESMMDQFPSARFFLFTPASGAIELASKAFPLFKPKPKLTDPFPLLSPPEIDGPQDPAGYKRAAVEAPLLLLMLAAGLAAVFQWGRRAKSKSPLVKEPLPDRNAVIEARNVRKAFGARAILNDFNLTMKAGESVVLWGANGAGKSTFLKCLLGLLAYDGTIRICGHDAQSDGKKARLRVGYLPQEFFWYDWTVQETLEFVCRIRRADPSVIPGLLQTCRLQGEENKLVPALSGGMKQKLALAQALVGDPDIIVLDEPCSNLDLKTRQEFLEILRQMKGSRSLLLTSHRIEEVDHLADRVVWLEEGQPSKSLSVAEFYEAGHDASPDGQEGVWVEARSKRKMDIVRLLERL